MFQEGMHAMEQNGSSNVGPTESRMRLDALVRMMMVH